MHELPALVELLSGRPAVVLTGAGCSTDSGIPDYRSPNRPPRARPPIQHHDFLSRADVRRRYWARSVLGWPRFSAAAPNPAHAALAALERAGVVRGVITQNVDGLHQRAGSSNVIELHGALARVKCLGCGVHSSRQELQERLIARNPGYAERATKLALRPDGDAELPDELVATFEVVVCDTCGGDIMPDVVFFGGTVPRPVLDLAWQLFEQAAVLLVVGSSLAVFSGFRFVRRAAERGVPVAIVNLGETRGDALASLRVSAPIGEVLPRLARALDAAPL